MKGKFLRIGLILALLLSLLALGAVTGGLLIAGEDSDSFYRAGEDSDSFYIAGAGRPGGGQPDFC